MAINLLLVFGGRSVEHEVSVISALQAANSLNKEKYNIFPLYIAKDGTTYTGDALMNIENFKNMNTLISQCREATLMKNGRDVELVAFKRKGQKLKTVLKQVINVALPIVHGTFCEDGTAAGWFELLGLSYVGCDVVSAANGMNKLYFKNICAANGIPVLECMTFTSRQWVNERDEVISEIEKIGYPVIVKPIDLGSSVGISKISSADELDEKISLAASFCERMLIERAVTDMREINCSVCGDIYDCETSVLEEPIMHDEVLSYNDKYMSSGSSKGMSGLSRKIPAELSDEKRDEICALAKKTFVALGCSGISRIDFIMDNADNQHVYVNEINTIPGSLAFYLWEPKGIKYSELLDRAIKTAFDRQRRRDTLVLSYDTNILENGSFGKGSAKKLG